MYNLVVGFSNYMHAPLNEHARRGVVCYKGMGPGSILGVSSNYLCTFLWYRVSLVHPDSLWKDSLS